MENSAFWENGIRFECQGSGKCCVSHGDYGHVYLTLKDRQKMADQLKMKTSAFTKQYCDKKYGVWKLKDIDGGACIFLEGRRCGIYQARPTQCRTWPFWPEVLDAKTWSTEVKGFCAGVDKGKVWTKEEIEEQLKQQIQSESEYGT